jgi:hypothetical protein
MERVNPLNLVVQEWSTEYSDSPSKPADRAETDFSVDLVNPIVASNGEIDQKITAYKNTVITSSTPLLQVIPCHKRYNVICAIQNLINGLESMQKDYQDIYRILPREPLDLRLSQCQLEGAHLLMHLPRMTIKYQQ